MTHALPITGLEHNPVNGCITALRSAAGSVQVESWGCEFGNWHGFFSQARTGGSAVRVEGSAVEGSERQVATRLIAAIPGGRFRFEGREGLEDGILRRDYALEALESSTIGDFVIRAGLAASRWPKAWLGDTLLRHRARNRMVQQPERTVRLAGSGLVLETVLTDISCPPRLDVLTYVRDEPSGLWIIHHRLLTRNGDCDEYVFRARHRIWSSDACRFVASRLVRRLFWHLAERRPRLTPVTIQVGGNIRMKPGERLLMQAVTRLQHAGAP